MSSTLAPVLHAAPHIPPSPPSQEWSDARATLDSSSSCSSTTNIAEEVPASYKPSSSHLPPSRSPSIIQSPNRHRKSPSTPNPEATRQTPDPKALGIPKSPSVPTLHHQSTSADAAPTPGIKSINPITRSPSRKKAPAYHSSYGVETGLGPPPSYSTQRTLSQDRVWRVESRSEAAIDDEIRRQLHDPETRLIHNRPASNPRSGDLPAGLSPAELVYSPETLDNQSIDTPRAEQDTTMAASMASYGVNIRDDDEDLTIRGFGVGPVEDHSGASSSDGRKSEDLFLNIARKEAAVNAEPTRADRRRSRISLPFLSNSRPGSSRGRDTVETFDPPSLTPTAETYHKRSSSGWQSAAGSRHPTAQSRATQYRTASVASRDVRPRSSESMGVHGRYSGLNSQLGGLEVGRTQRYVSDNNALYSSVVTVPTESTVSTNAPSTVWDELDDLKFRIKKLELTGKLPTSSAAAMTSTERPRTATTTITTMSTSPKHNKNFPHLQSAIEGVPSTVHPLLHEALHRSQGTISNDVYQKLQASAHDALQLFSMMGGGDQNSSATAMGIAPSAERQVRRRADDMCRNLTELAIALCAEPRPAVSPTHPTREVASPGLAPGRRTSNREPVDRSTIISRAQSRIETRRTSLRAGENRFAFSSPVEAHTQTPPSVVSQAQSASRVQRTATVLRNRRAQGYDGTMDDDTSSIRPASRAMTDIGRSRLLRDPADFSREYTSQHPMPASPHYETQPQLSQSVSSSQLLRRSYRSPPSITGDSEVASSPVTPAARERVGRTSVMSRLSSLPLSSPIQEYSPENVTIQRGSGGGRKGVGLAGRIGSTVGSRLRAVRAERLNSGTRRESDEQQVHPNKDSMSDTENRTEAQALEAASTA